MGRGAVLIDDGPGERREVGIAPDDRPIWIRITRASWRGRRALWGSVYAARATEIDRARRGAFLDLGTGVEAGFLPLDSSGRARLRDHHRAIAEGELLRVSVRREASGGKGPVVTLHEAEPGRDKPGLIAARDDEDEPVSFDLEARAACDAAVDEALSRVAAIPGGGRLVIEPTSALVAVDVDAGGRLGPRDSDAFALALNRAAAAETMRQLQLRALGGLVAIDFVSMSRPASRKALAQVIKDAARVLPRTVKFAPSNDFDVALLSVERALTPLHELMLDADGRKSPETVALEGLRALERTAASDRGARLTLRTAKDVVAWLEGGALDWRAALARRSVARASIEAVDEFEREQLDVRAE